MSSVKSFFGVYLAVCCAIVLVFAALFTLPVLLVNVVIPWTYNLVALHQVFLSVY